MNGALECPQVLIVGAGPAGLAAAAELHRQGRRDIIIVDRDDAVGGLPRFCHHPGFGWEYTNWPYSGPGFAARLINDLPSTGVRVLTGTTLVSIDQGPTCIVTGPSVGHQTWSPETVILATGIREANRGNLLVAGVRPEYGIFTTGHLQQLIARNVKMPTNLRRVVVVGTEHVAFSAVLTALRGGIRVVAMIDTQSEVASFRIASWAARTAGIKIHLSTEVRAICGTCDEVKAVSVSNKDKQRDILCDGVIFSAGWIPETAAIAPQALLLDSVTGGPVIDQAMRTSIPGVFAAGNVLRGIESSGWAALEGKRAGQMASLSISGRISRTQALSLRQALEPRRQVPQRWDMTLFDSNPAKGWFDSRFRANYLSR